MHTYIQPFTTRYYELGQDHRLRVQALCNYMEEAAGLHADALGVGLERLMTQGLTWVLAKMRLEVQNLPGGGEPLRVETWPVSVERLQFRRDFLVFGRNEEILAAAVTQWVVVGLESRRIERIPESVAALRPKTPRFALEDADIRIPALQGEQEGPVFPVRLSDIDQNRHVNNNRYMDFILEAADVFGAQGPLKRLDIIFRAEGLRGDVIGSRVCVDTGADKRAEEGTAETRHGLLHSLYRVSDGQELVRARSVRA